MNKLITYNKKEFIMKKLHISIPTEQFRDKVFQEELGKALASAEISSCSHDQYEYAYACFLQALDLMESIAIRTHDYGLQSPLNFNHPLPPPTVETILSSMPKDAIFDNPDWWAILNKEGTVMHYGRDVIIMRPGIDKIEAYAKWQSLAQQHMTNIVPVYSMNTEYRQMYQACSRFMRRELHIQVIPHFEATISDSATSVTLSFNCYNNNRKERLEYIFKYFCFNANITATYGKYGPQ
jgi:hypothetical protein